MGIEPLFDSLPSHWESTTLGEACKRGGGDIQTGPFGSQLHASDYVPVGIPSIMPKNIGENRVDITDVARIRPEDAQRLNRYLVKPGDIVYSRRGDVERRALIRDEEEGWLCGTGCLRVRLGEEIADPLYASYYLGHPVVREWIVRHAVGATMPNLNTSILSSLPFVLPPLDEQKAIAHILGTLDDKIELNQQMNRTLEAIARALFKSWFIDFDPVRAKLDGRQPAGMDAETAALFPAEFEDGGAIGKIPKEWKVVNLSSLCQSIYSGGTPSTKEESYWNGDIPWLSSGETRNKFITSTERSITNLGVQNSSTRFARAGTTVIASAGQGNTRGQTSLLMLDTYINQSTVALVANPNKISDLYLFLDLSGRYEQFRQISDSHSSRGSLTTKLLADIEVIAPTPSLVLKFDKSIQPIVKQVHQFLLQAQTLASTRDALLPKLLSGEIRVKEAEKIVAEVA